VINTRPRSDQYQINIKPMAMPAPTASSPASSQRKTVPTAGSQQVHSAKQPPQRVHSEFTAQNSTCSEFTASSERKTITRARTRIKIKQYQISTKPIPDQYQINTRSISDRYQDQYQTNIKINARSIRSLSGLITVLNFKPVSSTIFNNIEHHFFFQNSD